MTDRDRLIELIYEGLDSRNNLSIATMRPLPHYLADGILTDGWIRLPCKVGDTVWCIYNYTEPKEFKITILTMSENHYSFVIETKNRVYKHYCDKDSVGKYVFFTKEEAEAKLKEFEHDRQ